MHIITAMFVRQLVNTFSKTIFNANTVSKKPAKPNSETFLVFWGTLTGWLHPFTGIVYHFTSLYSPIYSVLRAQKQGLSRKPKSVESKTEFFKNSVFQIERLFFKTVNSVYREKKMFLFGPKTVFFENTLSRKTELFDKLCLWSEKQRFSINPVFEKEIFFDKLGQKNSVFRSIKKKE